MENCIFCKLIAGEIPTEVIYEDEKVFVFKDQDPKAPIHYLFVPKEHFSNTTELEEKPELFEAIFSAIIKVAKSEGFAETGYRIVNNCGEDAMQSVGHVHFHVLAGEKLNKPILL